MSAVRSLGVGALACLTTLLVVTSPAEAAPPSSESLAVDAGPAAAAAAAPDRCPADRVTIRGTTGNDRIVGTPGRDVIDGGTGNDVIDGGGGDDLILGGPGNDTLLGGPGNDVVCGGVGNDVLLSGAGDDTVLGEEGDDLVSTSFGADGASGGNGNDLLAGGPADDQLRGDNGDDALGGVDGDDRLSGDLGDDRLAGSEGTDIATGGLGRDACSAETTGSCETPLAVGSRTATIADPAEVEATSSYRVNWSVMASAGIRLVEVYANDVLVDYAVSAGAGKSGSSTVPVATLPAAAKVYLYVVVTDVNGEQTASDAKTVEVPEQLRPTPATTVVQLSRPTPVAEVVDKVTASGLKPVEYRANSVPAPAPQADPGLAAQLAAEGITPFVPTDMNMMYDPRSTPLVDQVAEITSYYQNHHVGGTPMISSVIVEGIVSQAQAGPLGTVGRVTGTAPAQKVSTPEPDVAGPRTGTAAPSQRRTAPSSAPSAQAHTPKTGRVAPAEAEQRAPAASARAAAAAQVGFWPKFGRFNVATYSRSRTKLGLDCGFRFFGPPCRIVQQQVDEPKAELQHQLVWTRDSLALFAQRSDAYEQNLVVHSPGRIGIRPVCSRFSEDNFYVREETSKFTINNIPAAAEPYNDTATFDDDCDKNEVSFGIVYPEKLADGVPADRLPLFEVRQESDRNDDTNKDFLLAGQSLNRDNFGCDHLPAGWKKNCVGIRDDETLQATLARTATPTSPSQIGELRLPACVVYTGWAFPPEVDPPSAKVSRPCGADRDGDNFDDQVDCAPDNPAVNPGAVDIPNDGIDQNCDGSDLTVGSGEIQVTLLWNNDNDQDLHVVEPGGTELWYSSPGPSPTGGRLDRDDNVGVCGHDGEPGGVENIFWPTGSTPARGTYRVDVVQYSSCGTAAQWTAEVRVANQLVTRRTGTGTGTFSFEY